MSGRELHIEKLERLFDRGQGRRVTHQEVLDLLKDPDKFQQSGKPEQFEFLILMFEHLETCDECLEKIREELKSK